VQTTRAWLTCPQQYIQSLYAVLHAPEMNQQYQLLSIDTLSQSRKRRHSEILSNESKPTLGKNSSIPSTSNIQLNHHGMELASFETADIINPPGGILTSRCRNQVLELKCIPIIPSIRHETRPDSLPEFAGCPTWIKPMMYREYQVL
jgi:hypothetical protein